MILGADSTLGEKTTTNLDLRHDASVVNDRSTIVNNKISVTARFELY